MKKTATKTTKKKFLPILAIVFTVVMLVCAMAISVNAADEATTPTVSIDKFNLVFEDNVYLKYAVKFDGVEDGSITADNIGMLYFSTPQENYVADNATYTSSVVGYTTIGGEKYYTFEYRNITAKQMTDYVYSVAYIDVDGERYYSSPVKYSVLEYAYSKLGKTGVASNNANFRELLTSTLNQGASAQKYFNYNTKRLANENYYSVCIKGGMLDDGFSKGLYHTGEFVTIVAPTSKSNSDFYGWKDKYGNIISCANPLTLSEFNYNDTYTAVYSSTEERYVRVDNYIYFGEYPQSLKNDDVTISTTIDERGYFLGSDGFYYAQVQAVPYKSEYKFSNGEVITSGNVYYFKVEPIRWRILSENENSAFILCDSIIANGIYDDSSNIYKNSDVRAWLNAQFYQTAFTELQRDIIITTTVDNSDASTGIASNPYACEDTEDKIFLLSYSDVLNTEYGFSSVYNVSDKSRSMMTSDYTRALGAYVYTSNTESYGYGYWWLRSPYKGSSSSINVSARNVYNDGVVGYSYEVNFVNRGIVPALNIELNDQKNEAAEKFYTRDGDYIYFGEYPQTIKEDNVTITETIDARGYYLGSDGNYYAKIEATAYGTNYKFSTGSIVTNGSVYYFKVEPIRWRILMENGDSALILCDSIIDNRAYDDSENNYANSDIRAWLNTQFIETAFNELQRKIILATNVDNSVVSTDYSSNPYACGNTNDKIFLLSHAETLNENYGFCSEIVNDCSALMKTTSDYSRATGAWVSMSGYYLNGYWWLRSPDDANSRYAHNVRYNGNPNYCYTVYSNNRGVVPALQIDLNFSSVCSEHTEAIDVAIAPTCTESGLTEGKHCSVCNEVIVEQTVVTALGHTEIVDIAVAPTCTESGLTEGKHCTVCNEVLVAQNVAEALGHTEVVDAAKAPTCTETGLTEGKRCSVCNEVLVEQTVVAALGHTEIVDKAVAPTCTKSGLTEGKHCSVCNEVLVEQTVVAALGHTEIVDTAVAPTCTENGLTEGKHCSVCNEVLAAQTVVEATGHKKWVVTGTETLTYYTTKNDSMYPFKISGNEIISTNKSNSSKSVYTITATNDFTLELQYRVSSEKNYDKLIISHNNVTKVTASGNDVYSYTSISISMKSGDVLTIAYSKDVSQYNGNDCAYVKIMTEAFTELPVQKLVTVDEAVVEQFKSCTDDVCCDVCFDIIEKKLGHIEETIEAVAPTCTTSGFTQGIKCSRCSVILVPQNTVDALGHTEFTLEAKEPTCTASGLSEGKSCSVCEAVIVEQSVLDIIDHSYVNDVCQYCSRSRFSSGLEYTLSSNKSYYTVSGIGTCTDKSIVISSTYNGLPVKEIGANAFKLNRSITLIELPESITTIGEYAFYQCSATQINIPANVSTIGAYSFYGCSKITEISIPKNITSIGDYAFYECTNVNKMTFNATSMKDLSSYNNIFYKIGYYGGGISLVIGSNVTKIPSYLFMSVNSSYSSSYAPNIRSIDFLDGSVCDSIGAYAFYHISSIESVEIPASVKSIGTSAFSSCADGVYITDLAAWCKIAFGDSNSNPIRYAKKLYLNNTLITDLVIPDGITSIQNNAFYNYTALNSVSIHNSVKTIGDYAFSGCTGLTAISIPSSVTAIGNYAFSGCTSLVSINLSTGLKTLGDYVFYNCTGLTAISIPSGVVSIGNYVFSGCTALTAVNLSTGLKTIGNYTFSGCTNITKITIPEGVISIGNYAFNNCSSLTSISIPSTLNSLGNNVFYGCTSLSHTSYNNAYYLGNSSNPYTILYQASSTAIASCTIHSSTKVIYKSAFSGCASLSSVIIPSGVTSIGDNAFSSCTNLTTVTIPSSVTYIGDSAFNRCSKLSSVKITNLASWCNIEFVYTEERDDGETDYYCTSNPLYYAKNLYLNNSLVTTLSIPSSVTEIKPFAFYNASITKLTLSSGLTTIGKGAFKGCSGITTITIPSSVTSIDSEAFDGCSQIGSVYCSSLSSWLKISFGDYTSNPLCYAGKFYISSTLTKTLTIPSGTKVVNNYAFVNAGITKLVLPTSVTEIGRGAFYHCNAITELTLPEGLVTIGYGAFSGCSGLKSVTVSKTVNSIEDNAFDGCSSLEAVYITDLVAWCKISFGYYREWDEGLFLASEANPLRYARNLYLNGELIKDLVIPTSITSLSNYTFHGASFDSVILHSGITSIPIGTFQYCSMKTLYAPNVSSVGSYAFNNSLVNILMIDRTTSVGDYALSGCSNLKVIYCLYTPTGFEDSDDGNYYYKEKLVSGYDTVNINGVYYGIGNNSAFIISVPSDTSGHFVIPETITTGGKTYNVEGINKYAFYACKSIRTVTISKNITSIENYAFSGCIIAEVINKSSLNIVAGSTEFGEVAANAIEVHSGTSKIVTQNNYIFYANNSAIYLVGYTGSSSALTLPTTYNGKAYGIYKYAFYLNKNIQKVTIPNGVTEIGDYAFAGCSALTTITIPDSITVIDKYAFYGCEKLASITLPKNISSISDCCFYGCDSLASIIIPNSVTVICDYAFYSCTALESVVFSNSLTSIGYSAFKNCTSLKSADIPNSVTALGTYVFDGCTSLASVNIPTGITVIPDYAFNGCKGLTSITIPNNITSIYSYAFSYCNKLVEVVNNSSINITKGSYSNGNVAYYAIDVHTGTSRMVNSDGYLFYSYGGVNYLVGYVGTQTSLVLPQSYNGASYEIYDFAFYYFIDLTSVTLSANTTAIGSYAFGGCDNLTSIVIPYNVVRIGEYAFGGCSSLTVVTFECTSGWWAAYSETATSGTAIPSEILSDKSTAAKYLTSTSPYYYYYWNRT